MSALSKIHLASRTGIPWADKVSTNRERETPETIRESIASIAWSVYPNACKKDPITGPVAIEG